MVLITRATLVKKTRRELPEYRKNWRIPDNITLLSYEGLSRLKQLEALDQLRPDLIVLDEVQCVKNRKAAVTKRIIRFLRKHPTTIVMALSGTVMKKSILDFAHIVTWCLKQNSPLPLHWPDLEEWSKALDNGVDEWERYEVGALAKFSNGDTSLEAVRLGFRDHLANTPGVVATFGKGEDVGAELHIRALRYDLPDKIDDAFKMLRTKQQTPDEWQLTTGAEVWMHARQLALGLYYAWDPRPPDWWRAPRKEWNAFVRETLSRSRTLDSELMVANACDAGHLDPTFLNNWRAVRDKFTPNIVSRWCDDTALKVCEKWMQKPGLVWVEHTLFGHELAARTGAKYYGAKGQADDGSFIEDADPAKAHIVSFDANKAGRNLQTKWNRNLFTAIREGPDDLEQAIGRTHRSGCAFDDVYVDVLVGCAEHVNSMRKAFEASEAIRDTTGAEYKILSADLDWPDEEEVDTWTGWRWGKNKGIR